LGTALIETFRMPLGPAVGKLRKALERAAERGDLPMQAPYDVYVAYAREHLSDLIGAAPPAAGNDDDA
ncbi:MAG: hypothetical protein QME96_18075, partial [Myxococcota bacterium]|nr:hypothetical protein [Myxococcota bacterium]